MSLTRKSTKKKKKLSQKELAFTKIFKLLDNYTVFTMLKKKAYSHIAKEIEMPSINDDIDDAEDFIELVAAEDETLQYCETLAIRTSRLLKLQLTADQVRILFWTYIRRDFYDYYIYNKQPVPSLDIMPDTVNVYVSNEDFDPDDEENKISKFDIN